MLFPPLKVKCHETLPGEFARTQGRARELTMAYVATYKRYSKQRIGLPQ